MNKYCPPSWIRHLEIEIRIQDHNQRSQNPRHAKFSEKRTPIRKILSAILDPPSWIWNLSSNSSSETSKPSVHKILYKSVNYKKILSAILKPQSGIWNSGPPSWIRHLEIEIRVQDRNQRSQNPRHAEFSKKRPPIRKILSAILDSPSWIWSLSSNSSSETSKTSVYKILYKSVNYKKILSAILDPPFWILILISASCSATPKINLMTNSVKIIGEL